MFFTASIPTIPPRLLVAGFMATLGTWQASQLSAEEDPRARAAATHGLEQADQQYRRPAATTTSVPAEPRVGSAVSVQVNVTSTGLNIADDAANEPSIAVDPTNPNRIAIGWRQFDTIFSNFRQAGWAYSQDAGRTWRFAGVLEPGVFRSDPVLGADADGNFFYSSLKSVQGTLSVDMFVSSNGGVSWIGPNYAWGGDKQWITVDRTTGIGRGNVYQAWALAGACCGTNTFTRSVDGGFTYSTPGPIPQNPIWGSMDVSPDGNVYVAGVASNNTSRILVARSVTAQNPLFLPLFESVVQVNMGGSVGVFSGTGSPNPDGLLGQIWVVADPTGGARAGWVYVLATLDPPGTDPMDVFFARSTDGGVTWSAPTRVNTDVAGNWQWFGTMSVSPDGRIDAVWNDSRNTGLANWSELYYASSNDGGVTWSANQKLSPSWNSHAGFPAQNKIGDYYHLVSDRVGANLAWSATFNGEQDVWFLRIGDYDCNGNGVGDSLDIATGTSTDWNQNGIPDPCEGLQVSDVGGSGALPAVSNAPNPFRGSTAIAFEAKSPGGRARVHIFDVAGRHVRTLEAEVVPGRNTLQWDGRDDDGHRTGPGVYVYRLDTPGASEMRRMVRVE